MKYFTLISQFNDPHPVIIDETELVKAITGQLTGNPVVFKRAALSGSMIKNSKIIPNYDKEETHLINDQWLPSKSVQQSYCLAIENAGEIVKAKMENRAPLLKEAPVKIHTQGMTAIGNLLPK